jgi:GDP-L-fucose synthase
MIRKFHLSREERHDYVEVWGTGTPFREFLFVDDLADAAVFMTKHYSGIDPINIGTGEEVSIAALAEQVAAVTGYHGRILFDDTKPDGAPRKILDSKRLYELGWRPKTSLTNGIMETYEWFKKVGCRN